MKLVRDLSALFALLIAAAMLAYGAFEYRTTGILLLWLALVVLAFLLLAVSMELENLEERVKELESNLESRQE